MLRGSRSAESRVLILPSPTVLHAVTKPGTGRAKTDVGRHVTARGGGAEAGIEAPGALELTETLLAVRDGEAQGGAEEAAGVDRVETVGLVAPVPADSSLLAPAEDLVRQPDTGTAVPTPHSLLTLQPGADLLGLVTAVLTVRLAVTDLGRGEAGNCGGG